MKIIVCPDSFKGTLSAREAADCIEKGVLRASPDATVIKLPIADGGEGTCDVLGVRKEPVTVSGPYREPVDAYIGFLGEGCDRAVIEMALCAGLPLVGDNKNPELTTTLGVGEMIKHALDMGAREILLCLGGSATNDCGCGMASALGAVFTDKNGNSFIPTGGSLINIAGIDLSLMDERLRSVRITAMCDVKNPLYGENGAAYVYAPQKGADAECVRRLDDGLRSFASVCLSSLGIDVSTIEGGGAAGGMGAGVIALLGGKLTRGIFAVLDVCRFDELIKDCDLVISGEGRFDSQSLCGKVIDGIGERLADTDIPFVAICGAVDRRMTDTGRLDAVFSIQTEPLEFSEAVKHTEEGLSFVSENICSLLLKK